MFNFFQRIGLSFFKKTSGHRKIGRLFHSEPLEPRVLLAADTGIDVSRYALFYALSRGGDELMDHVGVNVSETTNSNVSAVVEFAPDLVGSDLPSDETELTTLSISEPIAAVPLEIETAAVDPVFEGEPNLSGNEFATQVGENQFVVYDPDSGEVRVELDEPGASTITTLEITSKTGIFTGAPALNLNLDQADVDTDVKLFKLGIGGFGSLTFGNVAATGLTEEFWANDLVISGSPLGGGQLSSEDISVQLSIEDTSGEDVDTLDIGDEFFLNIDVMDDRFGPQSMERAVFGAYLDVVFDGSQARVLDIEYADFDNGQSGTVSDGLIDEIGAFTLSSDGVSGSQTLARVRMKAIGAGTLDISSNAADITPQHNMLVFGSDDPVDLLRVDFGSDSVSIVDNSPTAPDLVQFAKDLTDSGTIFYGASWCPHCTDQKEAFDDGQEFLPFVEVTDYQNNATLATLNAIGIQENIGSFPTWEFPDGSRIEGNQDLQTLSNLSGVPIPQSNVPTLIGLENKDVLEGSPLHLPLDGWDPNGGELTYTISVDDPSVVSAELIEGSRSLLIDIESTTGGAPNFGQMLFYLFEDRAGRATDQIISLAEEGFYDGLTFHRIIDNFMMQGGDPLGTGSGSSDLPDFSDQFHPDLQHNMSGLLSMAKSADDTNNSQFFITDTTTRHLDFNHTIFGKLIEGDKNRDAATNAHVNGSTPEPTVTMRTVDVVDDLENSLMMLRAIGAVGSSTDVTVTVSDQEGHEFMETFTVTVADDTDPSANGNPFLEDIPELRTTINQPLNFNLAAIDVEDDPIFYYGEPNSSETETFDITVNENTGAVELTPPQDFAGILQVDFWVSANSLPERPSPFDFNPPPFDEQVSVEIFVEPAAPSVDLLAASDTGESDTDNITNADPLEFEVSGVVTGATVQLISIEFDGSRTEIGESSTPATDSTVTISTSNLIDDGFYEIVAVQSIDGMDSADSNTLDIEILREDIGDFTTTPPTDATVGELLLYDADHPLELTAEITYSLANAPGNVTISDDQGGLSWTPTPDQSGVHTFDIVAMDIAGNTATQTLTIDVQANTVIQVRLEVTDLGGNPIQEAIPLGDSFVLNAFVQDIRGQSPGGFGVDAAYIDVTFDDTLASFAGGLNFGANYPDNRTGDLSTNGLIDEAGASTSAALGQNEILLWSLELNSDADGTVAFTADIAETDPFGLVDFNDTITEDNIEFFGAEVVIVDMIFARSDTTTIDEDSGSVTINILDNDIPGPDNTTIVVTSTTDPSLGSVVIENQTTLLYTPDADANGEDSFTYQITGDVNTTETSTGTVTVNITPVNDAPVANPDTMLVMEDDIDAEIDVLANDDDVDGDDLTLTILTGPTNGSAEVSLDGSQLLYSPNADFVGSDTLTYQIEDPDGETSESTVTITVTTVNDPPNVGDDAVSTDEDTTLTIDASTLLSNDNPGPSNESSQNLTVISVENATNGTVSISGTEITFTPDADFNGTASFDYTVQDNGTSVGETDHRQASGSVTVTVNSVNDAPVAMDDTVETRQSAGTISIDVLANDSIGADTGETLTIELVGSTSNGGTATIVNNAIEYTPDSDFSGTETFTYTINDGNGLTATATVSVEVLSFVAGGVAGSVMFSNNAEQGISGSRIQLMGTDINGDAVDQTIQTGSDGSFLFDEVLPGTYTLTSNMPFTVNADGTSGPTSITVEVTDDGLGDQTLDFGSSILHPQFAIWEALASTTRDGLYAAVDTAGGYHWTRSLDGWDGTEIESVEFSSDMSTVTITINDATNGQMTATVDTSDHSQVQIIGQDGNDRLVRIVGSQSSFGFTAINGG